MKDRAAALRYARAIETALDGESELSRTADELAAVAGAIESAPDVSDILRNPGIDAGRKKTLVDAVARAAGLSAATVGFLKILADHGRMSVLPLVAELIGQARDRRLGVVQAEVTTAAPLGDALVDRTRQTIERKTGRKVRLSLKTDPSLIGGLVARIGSTVYDGSVRTRLAALRGHIARG